MPFKVIATPFGRRIEQDYPYEHEALRPLGITISTVDADSDADYVAKVKDADAIIAGGRHMTAEIISQLANVKVIANGVDVERFAALDIAGQDERPTMALIGRVVPIKDIRTFVAAAAAAHREVPDIRALVIGPTEEDPAYAEECRRLIAELGLEDCVELTGPVGLAEWLPKVHVVVLTSLSEAQPLVLLEAGAAGIPCVATNVGACREIIEGAGDADDPLEHGGFITDLVSPEQVADRVCRLLRSSSLRKEMGESLRRRVRRRYASMTAQANYAALYGAFLENGTARHMGDFS